MATGKRRATFFNNIELEILMRAYGEFQHVFRNKMQHRCSCQREGDSVGEHCFSANRKKADARKTGGGPAPPPLTQAEELALKPQYWKANSDGAICLVEEPPHATTYLVTVKHGWVAAGGSLNFHCTD
ncbi:hypothetical protein N1851_030048 [Merluccius polli]|uniref:Uncharacterized protein n=1 Tax=Merluccius polli TaxID=89951 RepID=A0AA47NQE0_MERPO|nr:hypothetical protein N1851_030048 [Merluccius polli]